MIIRNTNITAFGGLHLIHRDLFNSGLIPLINQHLGERNIFAKYSYSDAILAKIYTSFAGGNCAEHIKYLKSTFQNMKDFKPSSADTILRIQKELSTAITEVKSDKDKTYQINYNDNLVDLLLKVIVKLGLIKPKSSDNILDFDHQFMPTNKYGTKYSYKKKKGYFPAYGSIADLPIYIENRDANASVKFNQVDTFMRMFNALLKREIKVSKARMDSGSYVKEIVDFLDGKNIQFYIRASQSATLLSKAGSLTDYKDIKIGFQKYQTSSFQYKFGQKEHRIVAYRFPNKKGQFNAFSKDNYNYLFIITNDNNFTEKQVIEFYNQRGRSEKIFDELNNDFNAKNLPFSELNQNTTHLILSSITKTIYKWVVTKYSKLSNGLIKATDRLKKFRFLIINIPAKITKTGKKGLKTILLKPTHLDLGGIVT